MKKRLLAGIMCAVMALGVAGCGGSGSSSAGNSNSGGEVKAVNLKMAVTPSETSVWMVAANEFKKLVEERTEGRYTVTIYGNEQLAAGDQTKGVEMLFNGTTDVDLHSSMIISNVVPELSVISMPWLFPNGYDSVDEYLFNDGAAGAEYVKKAIEAKGAHVVGIGENGFRQITNNKRPITSAADMAMLKIRVPAISLLLDVFKSLGADPTQMPFGEVFTALQQGAIDGQENPYDTIRSAKIQEVQKYMTIWNYCYDPIILSVSGNIWNKLSDADKAIFEAAGKEACAAQVSASRAMDAEIIEQFKGIGVEVNELSPEAIEEMKGVVAPIYDQYKEKFGEEAFAAFGYAFQ
ncbi:2,3-diketo-L-gulonate-binding periplasmic protein YiaO precursor [Anaerotignum neopropionicum]|uniref:2,3-diketo-L-gulonate-binding periplasmic protein YiaO n=1 Tax=Anaerotignum neopropionicum TaxID=36847 RepID=A0A136WDE6_9FIRM|nr:TRAP transporter substrate-binding protein DctP [Anaerotignum neopropionicum]KXL52359.1 2,3-diketo-L-gulonate-binding periplasmic protein YiaO precursor [Anaerotignum neopropionicum]